MDYMKPFHVMKIVIGGEWAILTLFLNILKLNINCFSLPAPALPCLSALPICLPPYTKLFCLPSLRFTPLTFEVIKSRIAECEENSTITPPLYFKCKNCVKWLDIEPGWYFCKKCKAQILFGRKPGAFPTLGCPKPPKNYRSNILNEDANWT